MSSRQFRAYTALIVISGLVAVAASLFGIFTERWDIFIGGQAGVLTIVALNIVVISMNLARVRRNLR